MVISNGKLKTGSKKGTIKANISEDNGALRRNAIFIKLTSTIEFTHLIVEQLHGVDSQFRLLVPN